MARIQSKIGTSYPRDILSEIFHFAITLSDPVVHREPYRRDRFDYRRRNDPFTKTIVLRVSCVCRYWREVALSIPALWSRIDFRHSLEALECFMERSGQHPLDVFIEAYPPHYDVTDDEDKDVDDHDDIDESGRHQFYREHVLPRTRSLFYSIPSLEEDNYMAVDSCLRVLETKLEACGSSRPSSVRLEHLTLQVLTGFYLDTLEELMITRKDTSQLSLKSLCVDHTALLSTMFAATSLHRISVVGFIGDLKPLFDILKETPNLETLELLSTPPDDFPAEEDRDYQVFSPPVELPKLQKILVTLAEDEDELLFAQVLQIISAQPRTVALIVPAAVHDCLDITSLLTSRIEIPEGPKDVLWALKKTISVSMVFHNTSIEVHFNTDISPSSMDSIRPKALFTDWRKYNMNDAELFNITLVLSWADLNGFMASDWCDQAAEVVPSRAIEELSLRFHKNIIPVDHVLLWEGLTARFPALRRLTMDNDADGHACLISVLNPGADEDEDLHFPNLEYLCIVDQEKEAIADGGWEFDGIQECLSRRKDHDESPGPLKELVLVCRREDQDVKVAKCCAELVPQLVETVKHVKAY